VCAPDPNAGIRMQARIEKQKKDAQYHSEELKYYNRETAYTRGKSRIARGLSRAKSDAYASALHAYGTANRMKVGIEMEKATIQSAAGAATAEGESRSDRYGRNARLALLNKAAKIEASVDNTFGQRMAGMNKKIERQYLRNTAKNRDALGVTPEYGMPVMMPPKGDTTMANLQMGLGILSTGLSFAALSDIRVKENIEQVGESLEGHNIYEWNYTFDKNTRYRGAIAQDVVKNNPMAVGIRDNYLTVDYSKIDVEMEVVS